jgi:hypothetical protein
MGAPPQIPDGGTYLMRIGIADGCSDGTRGFHAYMKPYDTLPVNCFFYFMKTAVSSTGS